MYRELVSAHGFSLNHLTLWKYPTLNKVVDIPNAHTSRILHMTMSPDGQTVCTGAADENLKFWKVFAAEKKTIDRGVAGSNTVAKGNHDGADGKEKSPDFGNQTFR